MCNSKSGSSSIPNISVGIPNHSCSGPVIPTPVTLQQVNPWAPACGLPCCEVAEPPEHRLCCSFHWTWQFPAAVSCQTAKRTAVVLTPHLIPHTSHCAREPRVNMQQRSCGSSAFYSQGKTSPTGSWGGSPSGDQLLRRALYKLRQAAAGSPGRCSAGLRSRSQPDPPDTSCSSRQNCC